MEIDLTTDASAPDTDDVPADPGGEDESPAPAPLRAAARGLVASMAMSGMREVTTGLGWLERTPPDEIVKDEAPLLVLPMSEGNERVVVQLAHWGYGTTFGFLYGLLPSKLRRSRLSGPTYGLAVWSLYEFGVAPLLGVQVAERKELLSRLMLIADHVLYGVVVAGQLAPEPVATPD